MDITKYKARKASLAKEIGHAHEANDFDILSYRANQYLKWMKVGVVALIVLFVIALPFFIILRSIVSPLIFIGLIIWARKDIKSWEAFISMLEKDETLTRS